MNLIKRLGKDILAAIHKDKYNLSDGGILLFNDSLRIQAAGIYVEGVNGRDWRMHKNLLVDQGMIHFLNVVLGSTAKISAWYLAPFAGSSSPVAGWTAANFTANATEITSGSEGYSESVRQAVTFVNATSSVQIDNYASKAAFTIVTATALTVTGLGLMSLSTKGGTTGTLISATKFATARVLQSADVWNVGYRASLAAA